MNTFIKSKPNGNLTFVNLKTFIQEHFENTPYILRIEDDNYLQNMQGKSLHPGVYVQDRIIDCNFRTLDSHLPEYFMFIIQNTQNNISIREAISQSVKIGLPFYPKDFQLLLFERKMFNFLEAIIASNFSTDVWRGQWQRDNCYVVKRSGELEYYTVYDYRLLIFNLLDWLLLSSTELPDAAKPTYRLKMRLQLP